MMESISGSVNNFLKTVYKVVVLNFYSIDSIAIQPKLRVNDAIVMAFRSNSQISHQTPTHVVCEDADTDLSTS